MTNDGEAAMVQDCAAGVLRDALALAAAAHVTYWHMVQLVAHLCAHATHPPQTCTPLDPRIQ